MVAIRGKTGLDKHYLVKYISNNYDRKVIIELLGEELRCCDKDNIFLKLYSFYYYLLLYFIKYI